MPADLEDKICGADYYAYIIAEDVNGNTETDYASKPCAITIPAASGSGNQEGSVTLDLANGPIDITPTGYSQNEGAEIAFTGKYIITGSQTCDSPVDISNDTNNAAAFDIEFNNATIHGRMWCSAVRIKGHSDININLSFIGQNEIIAPNGAAFENQCTSGTVNIEITSSDDAVIRLGYNKAYTSSDTSSTNFTVNGNTIDNTRMFEYGMSTPSPVPDTPAAPVNGKGLGVSIIADPTAPAAATDAWKGSYVYFGTYSGNPVKYRVLDRTTTDFGGITMLLDCDSILELRAFSDWSNIWNGSSIQAYLNGEFLTGGNFNNVERKAVAASTKSYTSNTDGDGWGYANYTTLSDDKIFLLDVKEATNASYGYSNATGNANNRKKIGEENNWWLRSPYYPDPTYSCYVGSSGNFGDENVIDDYVGVSPALNVNLSSVIFSSVLSGMAGQPAAEYKLTLHDGNMTITPENITRNQSDQITVPFTIGGTNGCNATQVSLMVLDKEYTAGNTNGAKLVAYEKLADANNTRGTFTLTDDMKNGSYYYHIVAEDVQVDDSETPVNEGLFTDYASEPVQITIPAAKIPVTITGRNAEFDFTAGMTIDVSDYFTVDANAGSVSYSLVAGPSSGNGTLNGKILTVHSTGVFNVLCSTEAHDNYEAGSANALLTVKEAIPVTKYTITSSAGANGSISPSGTVKVAAGGGQTFTITPNEECEIATLKVDGSEVAVTSSYTFSNVNADHTIEVTFKQKNAGSSDSGSDDFDNPGESGTDNSDTSSDSDTTYQIINGADSSWTAGDSEGITIRGNGDFSKFSGVKVDGNLIDQGNYTAKEGSTIVMLKASYLNTLSVGNHTFEILWTDGVASTSFTIAAKSTTETEQPTNPTEQPAQPQQPTNPTEQPAQPQQPTNPTEQPAQPQQPTNPTEQPAQQEKPADTLTAAPAMGDGTPMGLLLALVAISGVGLGVSGRRRKSTK